MIHTNLNRKKQPSEPAPRVVNPCIAMMKGANCLFLPGFYLLITYPRSLNAPGIIVACRKRFRVMCSRRACLLLLFIVSPQCILGRVTAADASFINIPCDPVRHSLGRESERHRKGIFWYVTIGPSFCGRLKPQDS